MLKFVVSLAIFAIFLLLEKIYIKKNYPIIIFYIVFVVIGINGLIYSKIADKSLFEYFFMMCLIHSSLEIHKNYKSGNRI
ncbi:MAG: hypothetical protein ACERKZ_14335 [Lachnotalea sp.]